MAKLKEIIWNVGKYEVDGYIGEHHLFRIEEQIVNQMEVYAIETFLPIDKNNEKYAPYLFFTSDDYKDCVKVAETIRDVFFSDLIIFDIGEDKSKILCFGLGG